MNTQTPQPQPRATLPWSLIIGVGALIVGLGSKLWGIAFVGAIFLGYFLLTWAQRNFGTPPKEEP